MRALPAGGRVEAAAAGAGPGAGREGRAGDSGLRARGPRLPTLGGSELPELTGTDSAAPGAPPAFAGLFQNAIISYVGRLTWFRCFCLCLLYLCGITCLLPFYSCCKDLVRGSNQLGSNVPLCCVCLGPSLCSR